MEPKRKQPRSKRGKYVNWSKPNWEPILHLARIYVGEFMWVCEIELRGGKRLQVYQNYWTNLVIHLDDEENAYEARGGDLYRQVPEDELRTLFNQVLLRPDPAHLIRERSEWEASEEAADPDDMSTVPF